MQQFKVTLSDGTYWATGKSLDVMAEQLDVQTQALEAVDSIAGLQHVSTSPAQREKSERVAARAGRSSKAHILLDRALKMLAPWDMVE